MSRLLGALLVPLPGLALVASLYLGFPYAEAERLAPIDATQGLGDVVLGAGPPDGFIVIRKRGIVYVWLGTTAPTILPAPSIEGQPLKATLTAYDGVVGRVTVFTESPQTATRLRAALHARYGAPTGRRSRAGGEADRWIGRHVYVSWDQQAGRPGARVRVVDTRYARHVRSDSLDAASESDVLPRVE